ncbi:MAG: metallophosphoesterase [Pirellulales bacterium]|nr:metallophosphoesterase [Pirellulales bacterium]
MSVKRSLVKLLLLGGLPWAALDGIAAKACDTCGCRVDGGICAPGGSSQGHTAQPAIFNLSSYKSAGESPEAASSGQAAVQGAATSSFKFAVVGDTQGLQFLQKLTTDMNSHNPALVLYPGDLVDSGSVSAWNQWKSLSSHFIGGPTMRLPVPGNHDLPVGGDVQWQQSFSWLPNSPVIGGVKGIDKMDYFVDYQNTRFISITTDSQANGAGGPPAAQQWLTNLLNDSSTQSKDHVFVYSHHPITFNNYDGTGGTAGPWWQSMAQSGVVDSVFVGHWHQYQPSQPDPYHDMWETIAGTGNTGFSGHSWQNRIGFTLVEIDGPRVVSRFYGDADNDGDYDDVLDEFVMSDSAPRPTGVVAYYGFQDGMRNVDAAPGPLGKGNTGAYVGDAKTVAGSVNGPALSLDGVGDYAYGAGIGDYNLAVLRDLTISIRANFDVLSAGADGNTLVSHTATVAGYTDREEAVNQPYNLRIRGDRKLQFFWERDDNVKEIFTSTLAADVDAGQWHEYRVTRDAASGEVAFYIDGVQLGDTLTFDPLTRLPTGGAQGTLQIGINYNRDSAQKWTGGFDGLLDELVIWNEVNRDPFVPPDLPCDLFADLNADCALTVADWTILRTWQHASMAGLTLAEAAARGDLNGDLRNDHEDFVLFKSAYESTYGAGSFEALLSVPEPSAWALIAAASALFLFRRP